MNDHNAPGAPVARLTIAGRDPVDVTGSVTFGRDPRPTSPDARTVEVLGDPLVSKSHFAVDIGSDAEGAGLIITDLGSSNGTFLHDARGETPVPDQEWIALPADAEIEFGDQRVRVEMLAVSDSTVAAPQAAAKPPRDSTPVTAVAPIAPADPWSAQAEPDDSIECHNCQRDLPAGAKFCDGCGTPTVQFAAVSPSPVSPSPVSPSPVSPTPAAPSTAGLWAADADVSAQTVAVPAAPPAQPSPVHPPAAQAHPDQPPAQSQPGQPQPFQPQPAGPPPQPGQPAGPPTDFGAPGFVDPTDAAASSKGPGLKIAAGLGALVLLGAGVFAVSKVLGGDDSTSSGAFATIPEQVDEQWSESVAGMPRDASIGNHGVYVLSGDSDVDFEVTSFSTSNGEERWSESLGLEGTFGAVLGEFGDVVVVTVCNPECEMVGLEADSGEEVWSEDIDVGLARSTDGRIYVSDDDRITGYDPATGDRLERVDAEFFVFVDDHFLVADGDDIDVYDVDLQPIFGPVELPENTQAVAYSGDSLAFAVEDELQFVDEDGDIVMEMSFGVDEIDGVFFAGDDNVIVSTDEGVLSAEPVDGRADERWSQDGFAELQVTVDGGTVVIVRDGPDDAVAYDADTGDRRFDIDDYGDSGVTVVPGQNAALILVREGFSQEGDVDAVAIDWESGDELWDEGFEGQVTVGRNALLAVEENGDVTYYR